MTYNCEFMFQVDLGMSSSAFIRCISHF